MPSFGKQQARDEGADDADRDIAKNAEAGAVHDLAGEPAGDQADEQDDKDAFVGNVHVNAPGFARARPTPFAAAGRN